MDSTLAHYFRQQRLARHLTPAQLARLAGYANPNKFCRRLHEFEQAGHIHPDMLPRLATALGVDPTTVLRLMEEDMLAAFGEWLTWTMTPIKPVLVFCYFMAADRLPLPATVQSVQQAEVFASALAGERCHWARLILSRRFRVEFGPDGEVTGFYEVVPARWTWQKDCTEVRQTTRERVVALCEWPVNPVEDQL